MGGPPSKQRPAKDSFISRPPFQYPGLLEGQILKKNGECKGNQTKKDQAIAQSFYYLLAMKIKNRLFAIQFKILNHGFFKCL